MQIKQKISIITIILVLATAAIIPNILSAKADVVNINTYLWVMVGPPTVGVNQQTIITIQMDKTSDTASGPAGGDHFADLSVKITKPDGTIETKGSIELYSMSGAFISYTPTQVGTYTLQGSFPGQWINTSSFDRYYKPSTSPITELIVTEDPVPDYNANVVSGTDYWERPIYGENKGWWQTTDNWLMEVYDTTNQHFTITTAYSPYTTAPNSAHVLWSEPLIFGGITGGQFGDATYYTGLAYEQHYNPLIVEGRIINTEHLATSASSSSQTGTRCRSLYTGEEIWFVPDVYFEFAQVLKYDSPNEHGTMAFLWENYGSSSRRTLDMYDAFTGIKMVSIENVTWGLGGSSYMGDATFGPNGEILSYSLTNDRLIMWNSTLALEGPGASGYSFSPSVGSVIDGTRGIQWNVSIGDVPSRTSLRLTDYEENLIIAVYETKTGAAVGYPEYPATGTDYAFPAQINPDSNGNYPDSIAPLWTKERTGIEGRIFHSSNIDDGVYVRHDTSLMAIYGYDAHTGNQLWKTQPTSDSGWAYFTYQIHIAYGKVVETSYDGYVRAWNIDDGSFAWEYYLGDAGYETVYGSYPTYSGFRIADGKLYVTCDEHSPDSVLWRGGKLHVIDMETGEGVWSISGMLRHGAIADGYYTVLNNYDGVVYTFGKGQSATTVSAPDIAIEVGQIFTVTGTVTDQSPGQPGTPCISDEDMAAWMEYLHMQKNKPLDAKGVEVTVAAVDSNGNLIQVGQTTSNTDGSFGLTWAPEVPGLYQIMASFAGSDSYGSSHASTYLSAIEAPVASPPPEPTPAPMTDTYLAGSTIAILAGIAIAVFLLLRKK